MPKKIPAVTQAFMDLLNVQVQLQITAASGDVPKERAQELAKKIEAATDVLQRAVNRAKRVLEQGIEEDD